ncbi:nickel-dependent lactate racemase [Pseudonocardia sp. N23]|uniref:nickel-dependent lactate racemase n=1 Tax=Pseudonocardia sp. N23 TaxID=1987376 RepID=UPI00209BC549|nr:nickel-dependent lactate racemase [Pseudonocardia sp. N23]
MQRRVRLAYGHDGLEVDLPAARTTVVEPRHLTVTTPPERLVRDALRAPVAGPPLREVVRPGQSVAISICDGTRPQPRELMLTEIFAELEGVLRPDDVTIMIATGTHRGNTDDELRAMLGEEILGTYRVLNHDARDDSTLVWRGRHGADVPVWLARDWVEADVRITTGFVEPHFFAGFSGGPKLVAPGLAALETVLTLHDARRIGDPKAIWGICEGNPVHDDVRAIAAATGVDFACDVILDRDQRVVAAFGGEVLAMHAVAREEARRVAMVPVDGLFDVVVTTNAGHPLDQNLYQAVKGMSAAATVVRPGGRIVCAAECRDGFPDHGSFREVLASADSPRALLDSIAARERTVPDQWQVQVLARVLDRAQVAVHTGFLDADDLRSAHLLPCPDVGEAVDEALAAAGPGARVCVLPEGPLTLPYVA